jgi:D-ribose pyranose/furanose isomerase RbsD
MERIQFNWRKGTLNSECSWHQLSPYIGRMKSSMARSLVMQFTEEKAYAVVATSEKTLYANIILKKGVI